MIDCQSPFSIFAYYFQNECSLEYSAIMEPNESTWLFYFFVFLFNYLLETPFYFLFLRKQMRTLKMLWASFVVNLATHPLVYTVFPSIFAHQQRSYGNYVTFSESFAPLIEFLILWKAFRIPVSRAFIASLFTNLFSWLIGGSLFVKFTQG